MRIRNMLLAGVLFAGTATAAMAQQTPTFDPDQLPATKGQVAQFSLTPRGDVDGVILQDGTQVHVPPPLGAQLVQAVKPGDIVTIHGLKAHSLPLIQAMSITDDRSGQSVVDTGPPAAPPRPLETQHQWLQVHGQVREPLYGPRGDMNGALLQDGTQVHVPPNQAQSLSGDFEAGHTLVAEGYGVTGPYGKALDAQQIGDNAKQLVKVGPPAPHGPPPPPPAFGAPHPPPGPAQNR